MAKRFFVSHASIDKPLAIQLREELEGDAWIDLHEIDLGDLVLEEISEGIEGATDFVLLWSAASAGSRWVRFEFHMAFIRWLEDKAVAIRVVCLDDTPLPLYFRPFRQARGHTTAPGIADALRGAVPPPRARRSFFNRNSQIDRIERALHGATISGLFIYGLPGIGKRTLAREALARLTSGGGAILSVKVTPGVAEPELDLLLAAELRVPPAPEGSSVEFVISHTDALLKDFLRGGGLWIFEDTEHWLNDDGSPGRLATQVLRSVEEVADSGRLVIFTARRKPTLPAGGTSVDAFRLSGLAKEFAIPLLKTHGARGSADQLDLAATELDGHPLGLEIVAPRLPLTPEELRDQRLAIATDMVDSGAIAATTWRILETLALVDGPLAGEDISDLLDLTSSAFQESIAEASEYSLVSHNEVGLLALHPLLRDYFLRSFRKQGDHVERTGRLADLLRSRFDRLKPELAMYVPALLSTVQVLGLAGRFDEARSLRQGLFGTLYQTAVALYEERRYAEALRYLEEAQTGSDQRDLDVNRLRAKTLAHLGRLDEARVLGDKLVESHPTSPVVLRDRGRVEFIARQWHAAIGYFERAIPLRPNPAQLWSDIAQARVRLGHWADALAATRAAIELGGGTPWTLALHAECLERLGQIEEAQEVISQAVVREPGNPAYRHRLGRIAQRRGNKAMAIREYRKSVELDPSFFQAWLSLASVLADAGDLDLASEAVERGASIAGAPHAVVENVRAKVLLTRGDLSRAAQAIESALRSRRDEQNLALAVRIWIARAENGDLALGQARAQVKSLSRELDRLDALHLVLECSSEHPTYFE